MRVKITKLSETSIRIEQLLENGTSITKVHESDFYASWSDSSGLVTITKPLKPFIGISIHYSELEINGETPASAEQAVVSLNDFIGNFNHGGSVINSDNLQDALEKALENTFENIEIETDEI
jgi:hypothetical protein